MSATNNPIRKLEALASLVHERAQSRPKQPPVEQTETLAPVTVLPRFLHGTCGAPNSCLRSSLFAAIGGNNRVAVEREKLACQGSVSIVFTGFRLCQSDADVWYAILRLARTNPLGTECEFQFNDLLRDMGRELGSTGHAWLKRVLARLGAAFVEVSDGKRARCKGMLSFDRREDTGMYYVVLNRAMADLFAGDSGWTALDLEVRRKLRGKPLSLWLHGWIASNATNYPTKVATIHALCGSTNKQPADFKRKVKIALSDLQSVGFLTGFSVDGDLVSVSRELSKAQVRHLEKQAKPCG